MKKISMTTVAMIALFVGVCTVNAGGIDFVEVGDPGNVADTTGFGMGLGAVNYSYFFPFKSFFDFFSWEWSVNSYM